VGWKSTLLDPSIDGVLVHAQVGGYFLNVYPALVSIAHGVSVPFCGGFCYPD
jgi:hypothetical protein